MSQNNRQKGNNHCFNPYYTPDYIVKAIDCLENSKTMTEKLTTQHYIPEWQTHEGNRIVVARIYAGTKRTSEYVPMPPGHWPDSMPGEVYRKVQEMYKSEIK